MKMTKCQACGTNGDHYCPADVARGPEDQCPDCGETILNPGHECEDSNA
jgi:hypothetical protein